MIDAREVVSIINMFNIDKFDAMNHPIKAYSSKAKMLELYLNNPDSYRRYVNIMPDIFDLYDAVPCLITDPEEVIETAGSIHCGTVNLASFIYKYLDGCRDMKIAVTCKPCDAMSIRELMKKGKIIEDNVIMIGVNCGGTLPPVPTMQMIRDVYELDPSDVIKEEIAKGKLIMETAEGEKGFGIEDLEEDGMGRRENCQRCDLKIPSNADLALGNWGVIGPLAGKATFVEVFSDKGADILNDVIEADLIAVEEPLEKGIAI